MYKTFSSCLEAKFENCKSMARVKNTKVHVSCVINSIQGKQIEHPHYPMRRNAIDAELLCLQKPQRCMYWLRDCLLKCYKHENSVFL
jgi:hypothetical protein